MTSFGQRLSVAMKNSQKSQNDIARALSVAQPSVHAWVHDKNWPSIKNVLALGYYLDVSVNWLLVGEDFES